MQSKAQRLARPEVVVIVVDVQERLLPAIFERDRVVRNVVRLIKGASILGVPILATEQYPKGLGPTVPEVAAAIPHFAPLEKLTFSACGAPGFLPDLRARATPSVIVCGIETHVCVAQTCLDLLAESRAVFVAADATSSRTAENYQVGLGRMREAGAAIVSVEMALFELLGRAGTDEFRQILALVK